MLNYIIRQTIVMCKFWMVGIGVGKRTGRVRLGTLKASGSATGYCLTLMRNHI